MIINVLLGAIFSLSLLMPLKASIRLILAAALCYRIVPESYGEFLAGGLVIVAGFLATRSRTGASDVGGGVVSGSLRIDRVPKTSVGRGVDLK